MSLSTSSSRRHALLAALCLSLSSPGLRAQEAQPAAEATPSEAAKLKASGDDAMQRLDYAAALADYQKSYELEPNPALLYNEGRALQALGRYPEALDQLEAFQRDAPPDLKARVPKLDQLVREMEGKVAKLIVQSNVPGARVLVRGRTVGTTPVGRPLRLNAGRASIEVVADGYHPFKKSTVLPGGGTLEIDAKLFSKATSGVLEISSPVAGASVFVDGKRLGVVPVQTAIPSGKHRGVVRHEGYDEAETFAVVQAGGSSRLDVPLDAPPAITSRWWFWTGVGVVVVGGVALTAALLTERSADEGDIPPGKVSGPLISF